MLSWKLWRALNRPPLRSPLFRRAYLRQGPPNQMVPLRIPLLGVIKNVSMMVLPVVVILIGAPMLMLLYYVALLIAPLLLPLGNTIYGLMQVYSTSGNIAHERNQQTYDVLCTSPAGVLGMHWSYCTGWIHYHWLYRIIMVGLLVTGILASVFGLSSQIVFGDAQPSLAIMATRALALGIIFVIDYGQTIVLSSLVALIAPTYAENDGSVRLWSISLFLILQLAVYLPTLLLGSYALPSSFALMGLDPMLAGVLIPLLLLAFFTILRELIISGLWYAAREQLSTTKLELDAITQVAL
ncbi:MAG: hypothetical protein GC204_21210 [Chloroflexi bacterium]|nr:hypothetical protein [Chloroflexota bacterium]